MPANKRKNHRENKRGARARPPVETPVDAPRAAVDAVDTLVRSEGQRLLRAVPGSLRVLATAVGAKSPQSVDGWRKGQKVPGVEMRAALFGAFAIPVDAWDRLPVDVKAPKATKAAKGTKAAKVATPAAPTEAEQPSAAVPLPRTLEHCLEVLTALAKERRAPGLVPSERIKLADTEGRLLSLRHRLETQAELLESRIVYEHPVWQRMKRALTRALAKHPQAARDVIAVFELLEQEG